jgi:hypothetical protein
MISFRDWLPRVSPFVLWLALGLILLPARKPVAAVNRWVADAIDPQPPPVHAPAPTCTLQGSHDGRTWQDLAQWEAARVASSDGTTMPVPPKCTHTRFAELTELPDSRYVINEESNEAWRWPASATSHLKATLEDARKQMEERGFKCHDPMEYGDGIPRKVVCYREE